MFTGIIEAKEKILSIGSLGGKKLFTISRPEVFDKLNKGASIACNGICLTVLEFDAKSFKVEVMNETLQKSTAGEWKIGTALNLERALKLGDRLDGHWLQGHIDKVLKVAARQRIGNTEYLRFELPHTDRALLVPQGSVAINGVSLTVAELSSASFSVALIGHTLAETNLEALKPGEKVNVEYDILGKYLLRLSGLKHER